ncbi:MAG: hypothetical protein MKZ70_04815, partial [Opitutales bacterium]|nr:hypothetical protein [Opitutales bacterium]
RWTGAIPSGIDYHHPISSMDMLGTMVGLTGVGIAEDRPLDGVDLIPYLTGKKSGPPHDILFWQMFDKDHSVIRSGNDKYIDLSKANKVELYDLSNDKEEQNDIVEKQAEKAKKLQRQLDAWTQQLEPARFDPLGTWNPPGRDN